MTLDAYATETKSLTDVRSALQVELKRQGVVPEKEDIVVVSDDYDESGYIYGSIHEIAIYKPTDHRDLIGVTTTIGVCCGADTSFYLFRRQGQKWDLIPMAQEANDYETVNGAQGKFRYAISPPSDSGQFFVVTKNVNPWCTSNWQSIHYQVMRQGQSAYEPKILLKQKESIYLGTDIDGYIMVSPTGFSIEFKAQQKLDSGVLTRHHVVAYQVRGDQVQRVPPFGHTPEDFLDEWLDLPWEEASKWVLPSALPSLHTLHTKFRADRSGNGNLFFTGFLFDPPACRVKAGVWQVGIELEPHRGGSLPAGIPKETYITVVEKEGAYFLKEVSKSSVPRCRF